MKTFLVTLALVAGCAPSAAARQKQHKHTHKAKPAATAASKGAVVKRGAALGDSPQVAFADVLKEPSKFAGRTVRIEGVVERVCKMEGCWMQIKPGADSEASVRVTFDHKFSVPKDADNMKFRAKGKFSVKTLSKQEVEHLVKEDGAKIKANADGTAHEVFFVATGVELWK
ncbi:MAG: DUF4920 domain-containing protein [Acidobacteria bacterium]|nr:DUF4920 domain-containing protein [Acidobacteriota bacterium]